MDITLLDGSIGQELMKRSGDTPTALWSTMGMIEHPELVDQVHAEYFRVGATIATTNTYPVLQDRLDTNGYDLDISRLWDAALKSARDAAQSNGHGRVAGSIGPLIATYRPDICPEPSDAEHQYADIVAHLAAQTDFLLIETVSSLKQAEGALRATDKTDKPVWIAFSVDDFDGSKLRSGENVSDLSDVLKNHRVDAVLVNCSRPEAVTDALLNSSTSIGLRIIPFAKRVLPRQQRSVATSFGEVSVKVISRPNGQQTFKVEHGDILRAASSHQLDYLSAERSITDEVRRFLSDGS